MRGFDPEAFARNLKTLQEVGATTARPIKSCDHCGFECKIEDASEYFAHNDWFEDGFANNCRECNRSFNALWRTRPHAKLVMKAAAHRRRARKKAAGGHYTADDIERQVKAQTDKKDRLHCWWCGKVISKDEIYHIDHRIPLVRGGSNGPENIVISHGFCNMSKHDKTPAQFMGRLF